MFTTLCTWMSQGFIHYFNTFISSLNLKVCAERYPKMAPLSTVLVMYRERSYNRDSKAWTSVVCKYLHNAYSQFSIAMMTFLIEVSGRIPYCCLKSFLRRVQTLGMALRVALNTPVHSNSVINYAITVRLFWTVLRAWSSQKLFQVQYTVTLNRWIVLVNSQMKYVVVGYK